MNSDSMARFFGGSPARVILRLVVISLVLGVVLGALGIAPDNIIRSFFDLIGRIYEHGFELIERVYRYFILGAIVVFPLWLIGRMLKLGRRG